MENTKIQEINNSFVFQWKSKFVDIELWETISVILNNSQCHIYWINSFDKVKLTLSNWKTIVVNVELTTSLVDKKEIWITKDLQKKINIKEWEIIIFELVEKNSLSLQWIKKKMRWEKINYDEIYSIISDISHNKLWEILTTYYVASSYFNETSDEETYLTAKAMAECWVTFKYNTDEIVADKHCIWWIPWNETTMIIIPTLASLWIKMPKNFSKAITSPAATWECVNVLTDIEFTKDEIKKIIEKNNSCLIWWWWLDLAPADDKIIQVSYPLSMQNISKVISSIMAKKYAMWINHSLIDIPIWPTAKVKTMKEAIIRKEKFEYVWKKLWMKVHVEITDWSQPIWNWIWAVLQVREVLRVLQQHKLKPLDLEKKAMFLAWKIIELVWLKRWEESIELAYKQLKSWDTYKKFQEIIKSQNKWSNVNRDKMLWTKKWREIMSEDLILWKETIDVISNYDWIIDDIDLHVINQITRSLWAPMDAQVWLYLMKKKWDNVKKWEILYKMFSTSKTRLMKWYENSLKNSWYKIL